MGGEADARLGAFVETRYAKGGSVSELLACARRLDIRGLYHYHEGKWAAIFSNAPDFLNRPFQDRFSEGIPAGTPLTIRVKAAP